MLFSSAAAAALLTHVVQAADTVAATNPPVPATVTAPGTNNAPAVEQIIYKHTATRDLKLFTIKPADWKSGDKRPAIVFFFGGGWVGGSPAQFARQSQYLASRGMVAICAGYRVIPAGDNGPPTNCCADAKSALRYMRTHAVELGIDPDRIAAAGGSAGGHLAAFTALVEGLDDPKDDSAVSCKPNALVLFNPGLEFGPDRWGYERLGERYKEFSPAHHISGGAPPTVIFQGDQDKLIPLSVVRDFEAKMKQAGTRCDIHIYPGGEHGFFNRDTEQGAWFTQTLIEADKFLTSLGWLKGEPTLKAPHDAR